MAREMSLLESLILGGCVGGIATISIWLGMPSNVQKVRIFREEGKPAIMRLYRPGRDAYMVQSSEKPEEYISLREYKKKLADEYKGITRKE
jgi:hypothetical protein